MSIRSLLNLNGKKVVLASLSPRRAQLLELIGLQFEVIDSKLDENKENYAIPEVQVLELAQKKALKVAENVEDGLIIGADTIVVLNNKIYGKPGNANEAKRMLSELSGNTHVVYTGFAIVEQPGGYMVSDYERTRVHFRELNEEEIEHYIQRESPLDKAGAYGIQDQSAIFVDKIDGCFYNVVGFPLTKFYRTLKSFEVRVS